MYSSTKPIVSSQDGGNQHVGSIDYTPTLEKHSPLYVPFPFTAIFSFIKFEMEKGILQNLKEISFPS